MTEERKVQFCKQMAEVLGEHLRNKFTDSSTTYQWTPTLTHIIDLLEKNQLEEATTCMVPVANSDSFVRSMLFNCYVVSGKHSDAANIAEAMASDGELEGMFLLARFLWGGLGIEEDKERAAHIMLALARQGLPDAMHELGRWHLELWELDRKYPERTEGRHPDENMLSALQWLDKAIAAGCEEAKETRFMAIRLK